MFIDHQNRFKLLHRANFLQQSLKKTKDIVFNNTSPDYKHQILFSFFCSDINYVLVYVGVWNVTKTLDIFDNSTFSSFAERAFPHPCYDSSNAIYHFI